MENKPLPEGVEMDIVYYFTSPSSGVNATVAAKGSRMFVEERHVTAGAEAAKALPLYKDWRPMTREEIAAYKAEQKREEEEEMRAARLEQSEDEF